MISIALDQSTSATKALLVDEGGGVIASASRSHQQRYPQAGWVEHDAEEIWQNTLAVIAELLKDWQGEAPSFLSITNQRETTVIFEKGSGRPLRTAIVWQCLRSSDICSRMKHEGLEEAIERTTGLKLNPYFSGSKLAWILENDPDTADHLRKGNALFGTIDSYLIYRLTNGQVHATEPTNASRTLLMDLATQSWSQSMTGLFEVQSGWLPEIRSCDSLFGETTLGGLLQKPIPICGVMGDAQAALLAQKCLNPGEAKATLGTGTFLLVQAGEGVPPAGSPLLSSVAWKLRGRVSYCLEGLAYISGAAMVWLRDQAELISSLEEAEKLASSVESAEGVYLVPAFTGLGPPSWKAGARAALMGMTLGTTRAHMMRAAYESFAYPVRDQLEAIEAAGIKTASLKLDGGASANSRLVQIMADLCQVPMIACPDSNASALGAWSAGMIGMRSELSLRDLPDRGGQLRTPMMQPEEAEARHQGWKAAVKGVLAAADA